MTITYQKFDNYYIFSHEEKTRVYLGDANPEDYIHDELEQQKRSASCYYAHKKTGERVSRDVYMNSTGFEYEPLCEYNFARRLSLSQNGSPDKTCKYSSKDKAMKRLAWAWFFGQSLEEYDARQVEFDKDHEERARNEPWIHNLVMVWTEGIGNETYYVDEAGNRITTDQHIEYMKKTYGEDVFELSKQRNPVSPEIRKIVDEIIQSRQ